MRRFIIISVTAISCLFVFFLIFGISKAVAGADVGVYGVLMKESVAEGETASIQLRLDNKAGDINAAEIFLAYPKDFLSFSDANDGNSIISMWVEKPHNIENPKCPAEIPTCGMIGFSGLIPGGFAGDGLITELTFKANKEGKTLLVFDPGASRVFLNSPTSEQANVIFEPINIVISGKGSEGKVLVLDYFPPENFNILLSKTGSAFNGKWFISFIAQDKGSGIDHYEIRERFLGLFGDWKVVESPYILAHQSLFSIIEIKAIDKVGLERIERIIPARTVYLVLGIMLGIVFLVLVIIIKMIFKVL